MDKNKEFRNVMLIVGACLIGIVVYCFVNWPYWQTSNRMEDAMRQVGNLDSPPAQMDLDINDGWDRPLVFRFTKTPDKLIYTVISRGPDGKLDTADDMKREYVDNNIARSVGAWTAEKAKEFLKGVKDGLEKKSKYEEK